MTAQVGDIIVMHNDELVVVTGVHSATGISDIYTCLRDDGSSLIVNDFQIKQVIKKEPT